MAAYTVIGRTERMKACRNCKWLGTKGIAPFCSCLLGIWDLQAEGQETIKEGNIIDASWDKDYYKLLYPSPMHRSYYHINTVNKNKHPVREVGQACNDWEAKE